MNSRLSSKVSHGADSNSQHPIGAIIPISVNQLSNVMVILGKSGVVHSAMTPPLTSDLKFVVSELYLQVENVCLFFAVMVHKDRDAMNRDNKRLAKIRKLVDELETLGLKNQILRHVPLLTLFPGKKMTLPNSNEILQQIIVRCRPLAQYLWTTGKFSGDKKDMYRMLAQIINEMKPRAKFFAEPQVELLDGELKAFQKYLAPATRN